MRPRKRILLIHPDPGEHMRLRFILENRLHVKVLNVSQPGPFDAIVLKLANVLSVPNTSDTPIVEIVGLSAEAHRLTSYRVQPGDMTGLQGAIKAALRKKRGPKPAKVVA